MLTRGRRSRRCRSAGSAHLAPAGIPCWPDWDLMDGLEEKEQSMLHPLRFSRSNAKPSLDSSKHLTRSLDLRGRATISYLHEVQDYLEPDASKKRENKWLCARFRTRAQFQASIFRCAAIFPSAVHLLSCTCRCRVPAEARCSSALMMMFTDSGLGR